MVDRFSFPLALPVEVCVDRARRTTPEDLWEVWHVVARDWHKPFALLVGIEVSILSSFWVVPPLLFLNICSGSGVARLSCHILAEAWTNMNLDEVVLNTDFYSSGGAYIPQTHFRDSGPLLYATRVSKSLLYCFAMRHTMGGWNCNWKCNVASNYNNWWKI